MTQVDFQVVRQRRLARPRRRTRSTIIIAPILFTVPPTLAESIATLQTSIDALQVTADTINTLVIIGTKAKYMSPI